MPVGKTSRGLSPDNYRVPINRQGHCSEKGNGEFSALEWIWRRKSNTGIYGRTAFVISNYSRRHFSLYAGHEFS